MDSVDEFNEENFHPQQFMVLDENWILEQDDDDSVSTINTSYSQERSSNDFHPNDIYLMFEGLKKHRIQDKDIVKSGKKSKRTALVH